MNLAVSPAVTYSQENKPAATTELSGNISVPGDKSITHRAYIMGSITPGKTTVIGGAKGEDCNTTLNCMTSMGAKVTINDEKLNTLEITSSKLTEPQDVLNANNSGTTARLLLGLLSSYNFFACLTGDSSLKQRPMDRVIDPLSNLGVNIRARAADKYLPAAIIPKEPQSPVSESLVVHTNVASAQVKSALLLASLNYPGKVSIEEPQLTRDHTERMLEHLGYQVTYPKGNAKESTTVTVHPSQINVDNNENSESTINIPGDISSAAFIVAAGILTPKSNIRIIDVGLNPTRTGFIELIKEMGADIAIENYNITSGEPRGDLVVKYSPDLRGITLTKELVPLAIDELPLLAVMASRAQGTTEIIGAEELRYKESDRIAAMATELSKMGADITEKPDGLIIQGPNKLQGTTLDSWGDHRVAMALAIAALVSEGDTTITDTSCINISYPEFPKDLQQLGVRCKLC